MKIHIPKYDSTNEFERRITNPHQWKIIEDGGPEQCIVCGCWDPTPVGMPAYSMAPVTCEPNEFDTREPDEIMTLDEACKRVNNGKGPNCVITKGYNRLERFMTAPIQGPTRTIPILHKFTSV